MKKSLIGASILNKFNNGSTQLLRQIYEAHFFEMHHNQQQQHQGEHYYKDRPNMQQKNSREDLLSNFRKWIRMEVVEKPGQLFTVLNYNLLSQKLLEQHSYLYNRHEKGALNWDLRLYNVIGEIFRAKPSILCCQEVQVSHLPQIQNRLKKLNYAMIFKKRTGDKPDGCAIFFKNDLFQLVNEFNVEFEQPDIEILNRENVAIIAKLALKTNPSVEFIVATTHLLYNPRRQDIRLAQVQILLAELDRHAQKVESNGQKTYLPTILTGDFNLQPNSAPFNLITNGSLKYENLTPKTLIQSSNSNVTAGRQLLPIKLGISDECQHFKSEIKLYHSEHRKVIQYDQEIEVTKEIVNFFATGVLRHSFDFKSVYHHHANNNYVSTHQDEWILVDYIFYSDESKKTPNSPELQLLGALTLPTAYECESINLKIPNVTSGSDHLSLLAQFKLCYDISNNQPLLSKLTTSAKSNTPPNYNKL